MVTCQVGCCWEVNLGPSLRSRTLDQSFGAFRRLLLGDASVWTLSCNAQMNAVMVGLLQPPPICTSGAQPVITGVPGHARLSSSDRLFQFNRRRNRKINVDHIVNCSTNDDAAEESGVLSGCFYRHTPPTCGSTAMQKFHFSSSCSRT